MLKTLLIKDYALIENIEVEFGKGLNIITGETGAGKSILIDAMGLLLGERASSEIVRKGASKSIIEGIFDVQTNKKVKKLLEGNNIENNSELIVRREISLKGSNRCFLNDTPVTLNLIKEIGDLLVDLHGQHEHQSLLRSETHIEMLDGFINLDKHLAEFERLKNKLDGLLNEYKELQQKENLLKEKKEIYEFQIKEIDAVSPQAGEEKSLEDELKILENSEKLLELTNNIYNSLYEDENAIYDRIVEIKNNLNQLSSIDKVFLDRAGECESALTLLSDISGFVRSYKDKINLEPEKLDEIRSRLGAFNLLKKKYGGTIDSVIEHRKRIGREYELAENFSLRLNELEKEIDSVRIECGKAASALSAERKKVSTKIKIQIENELKNLGISSPNFEVKISQMKYEGNSAWHAVDSRYVIIGKEKFGYNERGIDEVEFFISTNLGEDPKPLIKVASGGEVSRIMLSLKLILAKSDRLPILIFDEIDTGVSGRIAQKVGNALKSLSSYHQIIAITHLPQIAGLADLHFTVEKVRHQDRVVSTIHKLKGNEKVKEVARLLSGENVTDTAIRSAKELMGIN